MSHRGYAIKKPNYNGKWLSIYDRETKCKFIKAGKIINTNFHYSHGSPVEIFDIIDKEEKFRYRFGGYGHIDKYIYKITENEPNIYKKQYDNVLYEMMKIKEHDFTDKLCFIHLICAE